MFRLLRRADDADAMRLRHTPPCRLSFTRLRFFFHVTTFFFAYDAATLPCHTIFFATFALLRILLPLLSHAFQQQNLIQRLFSLPLLPPLRHADATMPLLPRLYAAYYDAAELFRAILMPLAIDYELRLITRH